MEASRALSLTEALAGADVLVRDGNYAVLVLDVLAELA